MTERHLARRRHDDETPEAIGLRIAVVMQLREGALDRSPRVDTGGDKLHATSRSPLPQQHLADSRRSGGAVAIISPKSRTDDRRIADPARALSGQTTRRDRGRKTPRCVHRYRADGVCRWSARIVDQESMASDGPLGDQV